MIIYLKAAAVVPEMYILQMWVFGYLMQQMFCISSSEHVNDADGIETSYADAERSMD